jgi:acetaldehyde dehydrogenase (acetylating)
VPAFIERSADIAKAVRDVVTGKCFDNGTICSSEQSIVAESVVDARVREELNRHGAYWLSSDEIKALEPLVILPNHTVNPKVVGRPAAKIAEMGGFSVPPGTRVLVAELPGVGKEYPLSLEKLSPILAYYTVPDWRAGAELCQNLLRFGGTGHTLAVHSRDRNVVRDFSLHQPASRIVVNTPSPHGSIGLTTDLPPSMTLGCGSWGGNITSDNISPTHLLDIKRVAFETKPHAADALTRPSAQPAYQRPAMAAPPEAIRLDRAAIEAMVEHILVTRLGSRPSAPNPHPTPSASPSSMPSQAPPVSAGCGCPTVESSAQAETVPSSPKPEPPRPKAVEFVCEDDVKKAIAERKKIYVNSRTIITPAARDLGQDHDVFTRE